MLIKCFSPYEIATKSADKAEKKLQQTVSIKQSVKFSPFALHPSLAFTLVGAPSPCCVKLVSILKRLKVSLSILS